MTITPKARRAEVLRLIVELAAAVGRMKARERRALWKYLDSVPGVAVYAPNASRGLTAILDASEDLE